jgi:hypothetical protein
MNLTTLEPTLQVYLDDERPTPEGWIGCRWPEEVIELLKAGDVRIISLDHDLGNDAHGTGYDVLTWLENEVATTDFVPPKIRIHSHNASAVQKMKLAAQSIKRLYSAKLEGKEPHPAQPQPQG